MTPFVRLAVGVVDCERPIPDLAASLDDNAAGIRLLVRRGHEPLGFVTVMYRDGAAPASTIAAAIRSQLGDRLAAAVDSDEDAHQDQELPAISVVVCTRERPEQLRSCLAALARLEYDRFEVVVVDNAPTTDATNAMVAEHHDRDPRFRAVVEPRPGLSRARNTGVVATTNDVIAFTDDDCIVDPWWLAAVARGFGRSPLVGCVTGLVPAADLTSPAQQYFDLRVSWADTFHRQLFDLDRNRPESPIYPYAAGQFGTGANMAFRKIALTALGPSPFDEALGAGSPAGGGEDLGAFVNVLGRGWAIAYEPAAIVWHDHRGDEYALREQLHGYGRGLGAYLTSQLRDPRRAREMAACLPHGLVHAGRLLHRHGSAGTTSTPMRHLRGAELRGLIEGPFAYARGRRALAGRR